MVELNEKQTTMEPYSKDDLIRQKNENKALAYECLETATEEFNNPDTVMAYLDTQSKFDRCSVSNALLVAYQYPEATRQCDSKTCRKSYVFINKDETGIIILESGKAYTNDKGKTIIPYNPKKVFDISQINARPRQQVATILSLFLMIWNSREFLDDLTTRGQKLKQGELLQQKALLFLCPLRYRKFSTMVMHSKVLMLSLKT